MLTNTRIEKFKSIIKPIIAKTELTESELIKLIITGSLVLRNILYPSFEEIVKEEFIKTKYNLI